MWFATLDVARAGSELTCKLTDLGLAHECILSGASDQSYHSMLAGNAGPSFMILHLMLVAALVVVMVGFATCYFSGPERLGDDLKTAFYMKTYYRPMGVKGTKGLIYSSGFNLGQTADYG